MRTKANQKLRKVGDRYMLVDVSDHDANITNVYTFNDTAAFIWTMLSERNADEEEIAAGMCGKYDVDPATALADVRSLLASWLESGLISE